MSRRISSIQSFLILFSLLFISSCSVVPEEQYDQLESAYIAQGDSILALLTKIEKLEAELDYLKNGAPKLLQEIKMKNELKRYGDVVKIYLELRENFPSSYEESEARPIYEEAKVEADWSRARARDTKESYEDFIDSNPSSKYSSEAQQRISKIKRDRMNDAYAQAKRSNSSRTWKSFLDDYPDHPRRSQIRTTIIQLEVDEIISDKNTGKLPPSTRIGSGISGSSSVDITNSTGYKLVVRYSGPSVKKIVIPVNGIRTVQLKNGSYKLAASAGGLNYAGYERLAGSYSSKFYISSRRY